SRIPPSPCRAPNASASAAIPSPPTQTAQTGAASGASPASNADGRTTTVTQNKSLLRGTIIIVGNKGDVALCPHFLEFTKLENGDRGRRPPFSPLCVFVFP